MIEEDELINIWQSSSNQDRIKFEKSKLILEMKSSLDRFHKSIKYRDLHEILGAAVMIPIFAYQIYAFPFILSKIGALLIVIWLIYVIIRLKNLKKYKPNTFTDSYINYLYKCKEYLYIQKKMRDTIPLWYILPALTGVILFVIGASANLDTQTLILIIASVIGVGVITYFYNVWIIKKQYIPRLKKMEELIKKMEV